ncbi:toll/interleukin-1 receptor domain-containing protein [Streptomyces sp. NPDC054813]
MASCFVTSFAAAENPSYAGRFHEDLAKAVTRLLGRKIDARTCDPTVSAEQRRLLVAGAGALVVLWSPEYFEDRGCVGDWTVFERRLGQVPAARGPAACESARVLVRWRTAGDPRPGLPRPRPRMLGGDVMADYNRYGLYKVVREQSPDSPAYRSALAQLAAGVCSGLAASLPALSLDDTPRSTPLLPRPRPTGSSVPQPNLPQPAKPATPAPRVLISYAHDDQDPGHVTEVKSLSELLKNGGIAARLDLDAAHEPQNWLRWMNRELREADFILMVASPAYRRRVEHGEKPGVGRGAIWEGGYLLDHVYDHWDTWEKRILRVVFPRFRDEDLPEFPGSASVTIYRIDPATGDGDLHRLLGYLRTGPSAQP